MQFDLQDCGPDGGVRQEIADQRNTEVAEPDPFDQPRANQLFHRSPSLCQRDLDRVHVREGAEGS